MAISKGKKKEKEVRKNLPKSSKNLRNAIHNFPSSKCVDIFWEIFQKVHLTMLLLLETYFVGKWRKFATQNNHCPVHQFFFFFFSFLFMMKLKKKNVNTTFGFRWGF
jgi:hypothetical protein